MQEDRATKLAGFGRESQREASVWALDPAGHGDPRRIAVVDRSAVPPGSSDSKATELGAWESSGIVDVTGLLGGAPGEVLLLVNVQAHGVTDGPLVAPASWSKPASCSSCQKVPRKRYRTLSCSFA